ncbi:MAG: hypothetical protein J5848_01480 [Bacteroidales bacterium]|nr:hypothetical protein [Bacteroidales bacterium]
MRFLILIIISIAAILLCFAGLGIKMLLKKDGEFKRHCAGVDPYTGKRNGCSCQMASAPCKGRERHPYQPLDINENFLKETNN